MREHVEDVELSNIEKKSFDRLQSTCSIYSRKEVTLMAKKRKAAKASKKKKASKKSARKK